MSGAPNTYPLGIDCRRQRYRVRDGVGVILDLLGQNGVVARHAIAGAPVPVVVHDRRDASRLEPDREGVDEVLLQKRQPGGQDHDGGVGLRDGVVVASQCRAVKRGEGDPFG